MVDFPTMLSLLMPKICSNRYRIGHFQNGIAESTTHCIQEQAHKSLLFTKARWPSAIDLSLWPYVVRELVHVYNNIPIRYGERSCMELLYSTKVGAKIHILHTFLYPVYALQNGLESGKSFPKWSLRARSGINLGNLPKHAHYVYLVLNPTTGMVSPQYHC